MAETILQKGRRLAAQIAGARDAKAAREELAHLEKSVAAATVEYEALLGAAQVAANEYARAARVRGKTPEEWRKISVGLAQIRAQAGELRELLPGLEVQLGSASVALRDARQRWASSPAEITRKRAEAAAAEAVRSQKAAQDAVKEAARQAVVQERLAKVEPGTELDAEKIAELSA